MEEMRGGWSSTVWRVCRVLSGTMVWNSLLVRVGFSACCLT